MQKRLYIIAVAAITTLASCGSSSNEQDAKGLTAKKAQLETLKKEHSAVADKIKVLESEIAQLDTSAAKNDIAKLVGVSTIQKQDFVHYIDLQGRVEADNISYVSPRLGPGQVKAIYVKKGDVVKKGQLLLKLDDAVVKQQIAASKQNVETVKTQLAFAQDIYNRRKNLWKDGIGTEVDLINARTNTELLERQLKGAEESIKIQQEQLSGSNVYSEVDGIADEVNVRVGEIFSGFMGNMPQIKIVNTSSLKLIVDVPENYSNTIKKGSQLVITLPDVNKVFQSTITTVSKIIDVNNRSFWVEAKLPSDGSARPNQIAQVQIKDYAAANTIVVPVNAVGTDEKGKFVYIAVKEGAKLVARKRQIVVGELYKNLIEVKSGITAGEQLITEGYQNIYDGQQLKTDIR